MLFSNLGWRACSCNCNVGLRLWGGEAERCVDGRDLGRSWLNAIVHNMPTAIDAPHIVTVTRLKKGTGVIVRTWALWCAAARAERASHSGGLLPLRQLVFAIRGASAGECKSARPRAVFFTLLHRGGPASLGNDPRPLFHSLRRNAKR